MESYVLEAENIIKDFPGVRALGGVTIQVKRGEILGLIGENGAGKSTILRVLNGWYPYGSYQGAIRVNGKTQQFHSPHDAQRKGIGFVPQEINVLNELTVAENIFVGNLAEGRGGFIRFGDIYERAGNILKEIRLDLDPRMKVRMLSIGQKQLLMIARALSRDPEVLILDEPTTALTLDDVENLFVIVKRLREKGTSIIFVTHKLDEIMQLTDRVTILRDGTYISTFSKEEYDEAQIITDMVGRKIVNMYPAREARPEGELLRVEGLTVEHPRIQNRNIIENVSFTLRRGEVLGLAGLVGSGRTETLNAIFGRFPLKSGRIYLEGREVRIGNEKEAMQKGFCMVTEDRKNDGLLMLANIRRNITISNLRKIMKNRLLNGRKEKECAEQYMRQMSIKAPGTESLVASLSGGNQQKVVIAKALNTDPKIILLDEPTKGIDVGSKNEIYNLINRLVGMGISIIMVSSELPELLAMCDRLVVMAGGGVAGELDKSEATQESVMMRCCK